jgi:hypothetical protein
MRLLMLIVLAIVALLIIDFAAFDGRYLRQIMETTGLN